LLNGVIPAKPLIFPSVAPDTKSKEGGNTGATKERQEGSAKVEKIEAGTSVKVEKTDIIMTACNPSTDVLTKRVEASSAKSTYHLDSVKYNTNSSGVYIYITTEGNNIGALKTEENLCTRVSIPLPTKELKVRKEKAKQVEHCTNSTLERMQEEKKLIGYCCNVIAHVCLIRLKLAGQCEQRKY